MVEAEPVVEEPPPEQAPAPEQPPSELTTNLGGGDGNGFGLTQGSGRGNFGSGGNTIGGSGSKYGRFQSGLDRILKQTFERHPATRKAVFKPVRIRIWIDSTGLITRARLVDSTGDSELDRALTSQALPGTRYEAPPVDMPMPITIRVSGRKP